MRLSKRLSLVTIVALACLSGCKNEISANLTIDGETFQPTSCRSGQLNNFAGVDLVDNGGRTLRLANSPSMKPTAILIAGTQVVELGPCGTMSVQRQNSSVNEVTNVEGNATLECEAEGHSIKGTVSFKNCH